MIIPNGIRVSNKDEYLGGRTILWSGCPFLTRSPSRSTPKLDVHLDPIPMPNRKDHLAKNDSGGGYWRAEVLFFFFFNMNDGLPKGINRQGTRWWVERV